MKFVLGLAILFVGLEVNVGQMFDSLMGECSITIFDKDYLDRAKRMITGTMLEYAGQQDNAECIKRLYINVIRTQKHCDPTAESTYEINFTLTTNYTCPCGTKDKKTPSSTIMSCHFGINVNDDGSIYYPTAQQPSCVF